MKSTVHLLSFYILSLVTSTTSSSGPSKSSSKDVRCEKPGKCSCPLEPLTERYPDPNDSSCQHYYLCHLGNAFWKNCPPRTVFSAAKKGCLPRSQLPLHECPSPVDCENKNGYLADTRDCTMYFVCFYKQAYQYGCQEHYVFKKEEEKCVLNKEKAKKCQKDAGSQNFKPPKRMLIEEDYYEDYEEILLE